MRNAFYKVCIELGFYKKYIECDLVLTRPIFTRPEYFLPPMTQAKLPKIFPYLLLRICGLPFNVIEMDENQVFKFNDLSRQLTIGKNRRREFGLALSNELFNYIKECEDKSIQNLLQNIRRDIFNDRPLKDKEFHKATTLIPENLKQRFSEYKTLKGIDENSKQMITSWFKVYKEERRRIYNKIGEAGEIQKGLVLSSPTLLTQILEDNSNTPTVQSRKEKKQSQKEIGLIKYVTRVAAKTSPFSTFTNVAILELPRHSKSLLHFQFIKEKDVISHVKLNVGIFHRLVFIFKSNFKLFQHFKLILNSTIQEKDGFFIFLTNSQNRESFQKIIATPVNKYIIEILKSRTDLSLLNLVDLLIEEIDAPQVRLQEFILELINYGMIEYELGISGVTPDWDIKLIELLQSPNFAEVTHIERLILVLKQLRIRADSFGNSSVLKRKESIKEAYTSFIDVCSLMQKTAYSEGKWTGSSVVAKTDFDGSHNQEGFIPSKKPKVVFKHDRPQYSFLSDKNIFFEDTTVNMEMSINEDKLSEIIGKVDRLVKCARVFNKAAHPDRYEILSFFRKNYASNDEIGILEFYEKYCKYKKEEQEQNDSNNSEQKESPISDWMKENTADLRALKVHMISEDKNFLKRSRDCLYVSEKYLDKVLECGGHNTSKEPKFSYGALFQFFLDKNENGDEQLYAYLNNVGEGYGKLFSRFLYAFDENLSRGLINWNRDLQGEKFMFAEGTDASLFNANLHPPLMPFEVASAGGQTSMDKCNQIKISDCLVKLNDKGDSLLLLNKLTNKETFVFNLCFQSLHQRSKLFQLLNCFNRSDLFINSFLTVWLCSGYSASVPNPLAAKSSIIVFYPRIIYEENIILRRKQWSVPIEHIPIGEKEVDECDYFISLNEWRKKLEIPDEVFIKAGKIDLDKISTDKNKIRNDDHKPQYINFTDPMLIPLLTKLVARAIGPLVIEEMLPNSKQLSLINEKKYVTESLIQWTG